MKKIADSKIFGRAAGLALSFAGGFMLSGTTIAGIASFADISLTGAVSLSNAAAAFSGALVRCVLTNSVGKCIVKLGAMAVILIAKMFSRIFSQPVGCGAVTTAAIILSGSAISALIGEFPEALCYGKTAVSPYFDTCGKSFLTITPGVRFADGDVGDQKRVMTPAAAKEIGSDYIVVGRPITAAADPVAAYERCVAEFCDG